MQNTTTNLYSPAVVTEFNRHHAILDAYRLAGLTAPDAAKENQAALNALPEANNVARDIALALHDTDLDPETFAAEALEKYTRAKAADQLRADVSKHQDTARRVALPRLADAATKDLSTVFNRAAGNLTKAATKIDRLDADHAIAIDAGPEYKQAREALVSLSTLSRLHPIVKRETWPRSLAPLANIVAVEGAEVEVVRRSAGVRLDVLNSSALTTTRAVRKLAEDAHHDADLALLGIARGDYAGVTLRLNDGDGKRATLAAFDKAYQRRTVAHDREV